jgi:hypothetical protein
MGLANPGLAVLALAAAITACPATADDDFSIAGTYVQNAACKGDGSDAKAMLVLITDSEVHSSFGTCQFIKKQHEGSRLMAQMSCEGRGGNVLLGEVSFTVHTDKTIDFVDQDKTYRLTLYPCPPTDLARQRPPATGNAQ